MNRRDAIKAGIATIPLIPSAAIVSAPGATPEPRVVWVAECAPVGVESDWIAASEYSRRQRALGLRVVNILERASESTLVAVEQSFDTEDEALKFLDRFNSMCVDGGAEYDLAFGHVWAIGFVGAGQVLDLQALMHIRHEDAIQVVTRRLDVVTRRLDALSGEFRQASGRLEALGKAVESASNSETA